MSGVSFDIAIGVAFVVGLLLFGISSSMLRSARTQAPEPSPPLVVQQPEPVQATPPEPEPQPQLVWMRLVDEDLSDADAALRRDMIERLSIVRSDWSRSVLQRARAEEHDPALISAIDLALRQ